MNIGGKSKLVLSVLLAWTLVSIGQVPAQADPIASLIKELIVKPESNSKPYVRASFKHWIDADRDGCDTRAEVLIEESVTRPQIGASCKVILGEWFSKYDEETEFLASMVDVDHMVPLKEAWESGASAWTAARRESFANDLGFAESLVGVSASSNRSKGDKDPASWLPPSKAQRCDYVVAWVGVKYRWDLFVDTPERSQIEKSLRTCSSGYEITLPAKVGRPGTEKSFLISADPPVVPSASPSFSPTALPTPTPTSPSSILRGRPWTIEVEGPTEFTPGESFNLRLVVRDVDGTALPNKVVNYTSLPLSGFSNPTDANGSVFVSVKSQISWGEFKLNFASDLASASITLKVKRSAEPTPSPTPSVTATPEPSSGSLPLITPGAFCAKTEAGKQGRSSSGVTYTCSTSSTENRYRWRR